MKDSIEAESLISWTLYSFGLLQRTYDIKTAAGEGPLYEGCHSHSHKLREALCMSCHRSAEGK